MKAKYLSIPVVALIASIGIATQAKADFYTSQADSGEIWHFADDGSHTVLTSTFRPYGLAINSAGDLYAASYGSVVKVGSDGSTTPVISGLSAASGLTFDSTGNLYVSDLFGGTITKLSTGGTQSTFASLPNTYAEALTYNNGNLYLVGVDSATNVGAILKFDLAGNESTFASGLTGLSGITFDAAGNLFAIDNFQSGSPSILKFASDGTSTTYATIDGNGGANQWPSALAFDPTGTLFVTSQIGNTIFKVDSSGDSTLFATTTGNPVAIAFAPAAAPEPSTWALLVAGLAGLVGFARRRRNASL